MAKPLVKVPERARRGEIVEIRTLIQHPMETGFRAGPDGALLPRDIITRFSCRYGAEEVFSADLFPAAAANPFLVFTTVATETADLTLTWTGDNGFAQTETVRLTVEE